MANLDDLDDFAARGGEGDNSGAIPPNLSPKRSASILGSDSDKEFRMKRMKFLWSVRQRGKQIQEVSDRGNAIDAHFTRQVKLIACNNAAAGCQSQT